MYACWYYFSLCGHVQMSIFTHSPRPFLKYPHTSAILAYFFDHPTPPACGNHKWMNPYTLDPTVSVLQVCSMISGTNVP